MRNHIKITFISGLIMLMIGMMSCTDYLDREPESILDETVAFRNFVNFQTYVEELYHLVPDMSKHAYGGSDWNWGEDLITSLSDRNRANVYIDNGDYRALLGLYNCFIQRRWKSFETEDPNHSRSIWGASQYGIYKANLGLANFDLLTDATQEEKDLIKGQLLFYRALLNFYLTELWGPMPYILEVLPSNEPLRLPRPKYNEVADLIGQDLREAADLLPFDWDDTEAGKRTLEYNRWRTTKGMALAYLVKNYLWAASPLMNKVSTGSESYNEEYAKKAADAAAELLKYVDGGQAPYELEPWETIADVFYTHKSGWMIPGSNEAIFQAPNYHAQSSNWHNSRVFAPLNTIGLEGPVFSPAANYVNYYGMKNGLPLDDPESGFDPEYPWKDRDPRFYKDIKVDGEQLVFGSLSAANEGHRFAQLYSGGSYRDPEVGSRTGYLVYKWIPMTANKFDSEWDQTHELTLQHSYIRLADIYLMYAEAVAVGYGGADAKAPGYSLTATDAINKVRDRAGVGDLKSGLAMDKFMSELRRERAVELAFEGIRFHDLRRWLLLTKYPYNVKTSQEFTRPADWETSYSQDVSNREGFKDNRVLNFREEIILHRLLIDKHYWLPLPVDDANMYAEFPQNPGW